MTCNGCVSAVRKTLLGVPGVETAEVDLSTGRAEVSYDAELGSVEMMTTALGQLGYGATVESALID
jgi:copper chaperone CopZ